MASSASIPRTRICRSKLLDRVAPPWWLVLVAAIAAPHDATGANAGALAPNIAAESSPRSLTDSDNNSEGQQAFAPRNVDDFVRGITLNPGFADNESLVRWNSPICLFALGFPPDDTKIVIARLSQIIGAVGAPLATDRACNPNFVIITTDEPNQVLAAWYARNKQLFGDASPLQIRHFLDSNTGKPILVWRNINLGRTSTMRFGHFVPSDSQAESSPFTRNEVLSFFSIFAIVDTGRVAHVTRRALTDYLAMTGLSNVDLDVDVGPAPSILRLFVVSDSRPVGLSRLDAAFLTALYHSDQHSRTQRHDIAERMLESLR